MPVDTHEPFHYYFWVNAVAQLRREVGMTRGRKCAGLLVAFTVSLCRAQLGPNPFTGNTTVIEEARKVFAVSCANCHGRNGEGGQAHGEGIRPPDLTRGVFKAGNRDEDLFRVISKGVTASGMPGFEPLGTDQIWRLVAFIRALSPTATAGAGDPVIGEKLFWGKGNCGRCHQVGSQGVAFGPDLTRGTRPVTAQSLKRSIVAPDEDLPPGYAAIIVVTKEKNTINGVQRWYDTFSARVIEPSGNERTFLRDDVISIKREMRTLMPDNFGKLFTDLELDHLVAYILKLRAEATPR